MGNEGKSCREIERKYLVRGDYGTAVSESVRIAQGYLCAEPGRTVRVRVSGERAFLTVKGPAQGLSRFEWEKEIAVDEAGMLLALCPVVIDKTRHIVPSEDGVHIWEVDEFHGDNEGLTVAEVELRSESDTVPLPGWVGEEVSGDRRYCNSSLSLCPYKDWK